MSQDIPVNAESLRRVADASIVAEAIQREKGHEKNAESLRSGRQTVRDKTRGKRGEFAAVNGSTLSTLCAFAGDDRHASREHIDNVTQELKRYGVW